MFNSVYHPFIVNSRPQLMPPAAVDYEGLLDIDAGCSNSSTVCILPVCSHHNIAL